MLPTTMISASATVRLTSSRRRRRRPRSSMARMRRARDVVSTIGRQAITPAFGDEMRALSPTGGKDPGEQADDDHDGREQDRDVDCLLVPVAPGGVEAHGSVPLDLVLADQLFDVDVLEGHDADLVDEAGRAIHVPYPGVIECEVEVGLAVLVAHLQVDLVGQVEATIGLDDVLEHAEHV